MPATFVCASCGQRWESPEADGGPCPHCQAVTTEPTLQPTPAGAIQEGTPRAEQPEWEYVPELEGGPWLTIACALLALSGFIDVQQMFAELDKVAVLRQVLDGGPLDGRWAAAHHASNIYAIAAIVLFIATTIAVFGWFRAAHRNLVHLEVTGVEHAPAQAVKETLPPWRLFVVPYRAVQELWLASHPALKRDPVFWKTRAVSWLILVWWILFLLRHLRINIAVQPFPIDNPVLLNVMLWAARLAAFACACGGVSAALFLIILLRVEHRQILRRRRLQEW